MQIMTPKARSDVHVNLPALQKLDMMLIVCCRPLICAYASLGFRTFLHSVAYSFTLWNILYLVMLYATKYAGSNGLNDRYRILV
jgi:hypothetical protein